MYDHKNIEKKWQERWGRERVFASGEDSSKKEKKRYVLDMFPYPSSDGLHVGHPEGYTATDIYSRYLRMNGYHVLHPMGWDAFGLPAENYAIKKGVHPAETTAKNIETFRRQIQSLGLSYDWAREINTSSPEYYRWSQWLFLQLYKHGLAYKKKAPVNWCDQCQTVLANEQVVNGACERCKNPVVQKELEQWFFKVTKYADELISALDSLDWPEPIKAAQKNWIGKSEGAKIRFEVTGYRLQVLGQGTGDRLQVTEGAEETSNLEPRTYNLEPCIEVFTTRPDTLFGATYMVLAPEHVLVDELKSVIKNWKAVNAYRAKTKKKSELERTHLGKEKTGVPLEGVTATNPANGEDIPVWIADYVLASYGTGAIMAVPAHDQRDFEFAKKFSLPIRMVICPHYPAPTCPILEEAYEGDGHLVKSGNFSGLPAEEAKWKITKKVKGERVMQYRLRDWLISRQRYWGAPIPIIYCESCGAVPVPAADLPVLLPTDVDFKPTGESPLSRSQSFHEVSCPSCGKKARRESDTMDTFVCSSWYYLRYASPNETAEPFTKETVDYWLPVDMYVGGAEHAVLHLLYARFVTKALRDMGFVSFGEPFTRLRNQGMILGEDGEKMSKSRGNVINPDEIVDRHGADTLRMYEMFMGPFEQTKPWSAGSIMGIRRFLERVWKLYTVIPSAVEESTSVQRHHGSLDSVQSLGMTLEKLLHKTIKKVTDDIVTFNFNTAVSALMILFNEMSAVAQKETLPAHALDSFLLLLAPFAPHLSEELWEQSGHDTMIANAKWPAYDSEKIADASVKLIIQVNSKVRDTVEIPSDTSAEEIKQIAHARERVKKWLDGKRVKKEIVVSNTLINIVLE